MELIAMFEKVKIFCLDVKSWFFMRLKQNVIFIVSRVYIPHLSLDIGPVRIFLNSSIMVDSGLINVKPINPYFICRILFFSSQVDLWIQKYTKEKIESIENQHLTEIFLNRVVTTPVHYKYIYEFESTQRKRSGLWEVSIWLRFL